MKRCMVRLVFLDRQIMVFNYVSSLICPRRDPILYMEVIVILNVSLGHAIA
jgi:hypothetical protein